MATLDPLIAADQQLAELERAAYFGALSTPAPCASALLYAPSLLLMSFGAWADAVRTYCDKVSQGLASGGRGR